MRLDALARETAGGAQQQPQPPAVQLGKGSEGGSAGVRSGSSSSLPGSAERVLKFEVQMYKMRDGEYCLDIQVCARASLCCAMHPCPARSYACA